MFGSLTSARAIEKSPGSGEVNATIAAWSHDMEGHAKASSNIEQLYRVSTPCIDDHQLKMHSLVCKQTGKSSHVGNAANGCRLGLVQDSDFYGDLADSACCGDAGAIPGTGRAPRTLAGSPIDMEVDELVLAVSHESEDEILQGQFYCEGGCGKHSKRERRSMQISMGLCGRVVKVKPGSSWRMPCHGRCAQRRHVVQGSAL